MTDNNILALCKEGISAWQKAQGTTKLPQGPITITAPNALMDIVIAPTIAKLLLQYPLLEPELNSGSLKLMVKLA